MADKKWPIKNCAILKQWFNVNEYRVIYDEYKVLTIHSVTITISIDTDSFIFLYYSITFYTFFHAKFDFVVQINVTTLLMLLQLTILGFFTFKKAKK